MLAALALAAGIFLVRGGAGGRPNVVLVVIDTCRADHLGCYGHGNATSPHIDSLAASGALFRACSSQAPWTLPSFASLLASQRPSEHGAGGRLGDFRRFDLSTRLLPEELLDNGYSTAAIANVKWLEPQFRFSKGFQIYDYRTTDATNTGHRTAGATTAVALATIDRLPEPFFIMVHYFDPHVKYEPPPPYDAMFTGGYRGPYGRAFGNADEVLAARQGKLELDEAARQHLRDLYDGEIAFTDAEIGRLLDGLRERGIDRRTLVVLTADHGEEFWDHGDFEHGHSLYEDQIHVPLVMSAPGSIERGRVVDAPVAQIDIAPTILDLVGIESPPGFRGHSLVDRIGVRSARPRTARDRRVGEGVVFAEAVLWGDDRECLRVGSHKLIVNRVSGAVELYDLAADPGEATNLAAERPELLARLEGIMERQKRAMARGGDGDQAPLDEETRRQLEALGYTQ